MQSKPSHFSAGETQDIRLICTAAQMMLENGGETYRVEETAMRMAIGLSLEDVNVVAFPTSIYVNVGDRCRIRRITRRGTNTLRLARINDISRKVERGELNADEAERDVDDLFKSRYMKKHIGEEFEGVVSGVTSFGVFVELPNTVEGLIKIDTLPPASYDFDKKTYTLSSKKVSFHLGERVRIMVAGVDSANRKIEFIFINKP